MQKIIVAGGGMVGMLFALRVRQKAGDAIEVVICDAAQDQKRKLGRASTIAAGPRHALQSAGVWADIAAHIQPVNAMHITDSRQKDALRPIYLHLDGTVAHGEPFAHVVEEAPLLEALSHHCKQAGVHFSNSDLRQITQEKGRVTAAFDDQSSQSAALLIGADGARSKARRAMKIATTGWGYDQTGLVGTLSLERSHESIAIQHFLGGGPFALLPLSGNRASFVWTLPTASAERLLRASPADLLQELEDCLGGQYGQLALIAPLRGFPLRLQIARSFIGQRFALMGDAAHVVHPLAGQGVNLGLADAITLADIIVKQAQLGLDIGAQSCLQDYQRARRGEATLMAAATDGLNHLFSNDLLPVRLLRDLGMGLIERMPRAKARIIRHAAGDVNAG